MPDRLPTIRIFISSPSDVFWVLEVARRDQRLTLPQHGLDVEALRELTIEPSNDLLGLQPLRPHTSRSRAVPISSS